MTDKTAPDYTDTVSAGWRGLMPDIDLQYPEAALRLLRIGRLVDRLIDTAAGDHGLVVSGDYEVLATLRRSHPEPLQPAELAARTMVTTSGMTGRLDRLERSALIERRSNPVDRRATDIHITKIGIKTADAVFRTIVERETELFGALRRAELRTLSDLVRTLLLDLGDTLPEPD